MQNPPAKLVKRVARVATEITNTIRVPHDRFGNRKGDYYTSAGMPAVKDGNQVNFIVDAEDAFKEMAAAIQTAKTDKHFIYMMNWYCDVDFVLAPGQTLKKLLTRASNDRVMIRAMLWRPPEPFLRQNDAAVNFLNSVEIKMTSAGPQPFRKDPPLFNSAAIHDARGDQPLPIPILGIFPRSLGSQHQKVLCVFGEKGLICFCGGVDFNPDRIQVSGKHGEPLHDVHCRIMGPAALEFVKTFEEKWKDHVHRRVLFGPEDPFPTFQNSEAIDEKLGPLIIPPEPPAQSDHSVQVGRTFGNTGYRIIPPEHTAADMIANAIRAAKRFIYTECQYFTGNPELEGALKEALGRIEHLTVVVTHWEISDLPTVNAHRRTFFGNLKAVGGDKVRIFSLQPDGNTPEFQDGKVAHTYVHSKTWVIDDEFAVIGSLNSNKRSWTHDTEIAAGIYETSTDQMLHYRLAHLLRIKIWQEHLNMKTPQGEAELANGVASAVHWLRLTAGARVRPYNVDDRDRKGHNDVGPGIAGAVWDLALDPA